MTICNYLGELRFQYRVIHTILHYIFHYDMYGTHLIGMGNGNIIRRRTGTAQHHTKYIQWGTRGQDARYARAHMIRNTV